MSDFEKTYTLKDLEGMLHVKERTLFRYISEEKLKGSKHGKWFFREEDVQDFLESGERDNDHA